MKMTKRHMHTHTHDTPGFPYPLLIFPATLALGTLVGVWLTGKMLCVLETIALTNVLDEMGENLADAEKAELERRIRERIFAESHFGCCCR